MIRRPPRSTQGSSSAASDVYKGLLGSGSERRGLGPCLCPGIAISLALLSVEQSTAQIAASHSCIRLATVAWTCRSDKSWFLLINQSIGSTFQPHHASAYATGAFFPENTSSADGGLSGAGLLVPLLAAGSAEAGASQRWSFAACFAPHTRPPLRTLLHRCL